MTDIDLQSLFVTDIDLRGLSERIKALPIEQKFYLVGALIRQAKIDPDRAHAEQTLRIAHQIAQAAAIDLGAALALRAHHGG